MIQIRSPIGKRASNFYLKSLETLLKKEYNNLMEEFKMKLVGNDTFNGMNKLNEMNNQGKLYMTLLNSIDNLKDEIYEFEAAYNELSFVSGDDIEEDELQKEIITSRLLDFYRDLEQCKDQLIKTAKGFTLKEIQYLHVNYKSYQS